MSVGLRMRFCWVNSMSERRLKNDRRFIERLEKSEGIDYRGRKMEGDSVVASTATRYLDPLKRGRTKNLVRLSVWRIIMICFIGQHFLVGLTCQTNATGSAAFCARENQVPWLNKWRSYLNIRKVVCPLFWLLYCFVWSFCCNDSYFHTVLWCWAFSFSPVYSATGKIMVSNFSDYKLKFLNEKYIIRIRKIIFSECFFWTFEVEWFNFIFIFLL
jgi:hypothetical protein